MKNLKIKYRFSPKWTYTKQRYSNQNESNKYIITEVSQICPIFTDDETKPIGNVIINGELYESPDKKRYYLYKANHIYILPGGTINVIYMDNNLKNNYDELDNTIFLPGTVLKSNFSTGGSGDYAFKTGNVSLYNDDSWVRTVYFNFTN